MTSHNSASGNLYDVPPFDGEDDYLSDRALDLIAERVLSRLPSDGFELGHTNATMKGVTATIKLAGADPMLQVDRLDAMLHAVTFARCLHANLVAARAEIERLRSAIRRIGSMEAFREAGVLDRESREGRELLARIDFAREALGHE